VCFCSACNERLLISYEEKNNELLRRRSLSLAAEREESDVPPAPTASHDRTIHGDHNSDENSNCEPNYEVEEFTGYLHEQEQEEDNAAAYEDSYEGNLYETNEFQGPYDQDANQGEGENGNVVADATAVNAGEAAESEAVDQPGAAGTVDDEADEIDYDTAIQSTADVHFASDLVASTGDNEGFEGFTASRYNHDPDEISYEEADIPESNESERTLIADEPAQDLGIGQTEQAHDEINYESDDQQNLDSPSGRKTIIEESPTSNGHTGKRQRADAEDIMDRAPKRRCTCLVKTNISNRPSIESKRVRS
jgi:hypothetical protein